MNAKKCKNDTKLSVEPVTFGLVSLGCPKNLVDTEKMSATLMENGFVLHEDETSADIIIINTCSFIAPAREESYAVIREFCELRRKGLIRALVVTGCLVQQKGEGLLDKHPEIDAAVSFSAYPRIAVIIREVLDLGSRTFNGGQDYELTVESPRLVLSGPYSAYLRISEGCSNTCTFCTIPSIRGEFRSKPENAVLEEAGELVGIGIKELILIGQDTTAYGSDLDGNANLARIAGKIGSIKGVEWVRIMYANPARTSEELVNVIADTPEIVKYLDVPIQHISGRVLKRMGRRHGEKETRELIEHLHNRVPDLTLRTSLLVGFPGETEDDFQRLLEFVKEGHFQRLGVFTYSREEGTPASRMGKPVPPEEASGRCEEIMLAQQDSVFKFTRSLMGKRLDTLVEYMNEDGSFSGRTCMDAPEVDCAAIINSASVQPGDIAGMEVVDSSGYDLILEDR